MGAIRKVGVEFYAGIELSPDTTGKAGTFDLKYKLRGTDTVFQSLGVAWTEEKAGTYTVPFTPASVGEYIISMESSDPSIGTETANLTVVNANIDDVKAAVDAAQGDITAIKATTDLLNTTEMEGLSEQIDGVVTQLTNLTAEITSVDGADAITSIKELLIDIQNGGANVDSLLNGQADIRAVVLGDEFLSDGTTPNPAYGKGLDEIFDKVSSNLTDIDGYITAAKTSIETNIANFKTSVEGKVDAVKTVVDANATAIAQNGTDIAGVKTVVDGLAVSVAEIGGDTDAIIATLGDATNGLEAIKNLIVSRFDAVDAAISTVDGKVDNIGAAVTAKIFL